MKTASLAACGKPIVAQQSFEWPACLGQEENTPAGCSKRPSSKAAASEEAMRTLRYVEPLSEARTLLADFFSILLGQGVWIGKGEVEKMVGDTGIEPVASSV